VERRLGKLLAWDSSRYSEHRDTVGYLREHMRGVVLDCFLRVPPQTVEVQRAIALGLSHQYASEDNLEKTALILKGLQSDDPIVQKHIATASEGREEARNALSEAGITPWPICAILLRLRR